MLEKFKNMGKALKEAQNMKGMMEDVQKQLEKSIIPVSELNGKIKIESQESFRWLNLKLTLHC